MVYEGGAMKKKICKDRKLYWRWHGMISRCENPKCAAYHNYGARGITVCKEWKESYSAFEEWAFANGYRSDLSIDRIDNNKGYCPENCRWTDFVTQQNNRRMNKNVTLNGETHTFSEWVRIKNLCKRTIYRRIESGMSVEEALTKPIGEAHRPRKFNREEHL